MSASTVVGVKRYGMTVDDGDYLVQAFEVLETTPQGNYVLLMYDGFGCPHHERIANEEWFIRQNGLWPCREDWQYAIGLMQLRLQARLEAERPSAEVL